MLCGGVCPDRDRARATGFTDLHGLVSQPAGLGADAAAPGTQTALGSSHDAPSDRSQGRHLTILSSLCKVYRLVF